jgi:hypothetical protein
VPRGGRETGERGPRARGEGRGQQWPLAIGRVWWRCCVNKGERWGAGDVALRDWHAGLGGVGARWQWSGYARERRAGKRGDGVLTGGPTQCRGTV